ncbi:MAG: SRPBCC family protein, partial [Bdellovibrionales bacterium]|nr:SRPBCC family protein [Bdellovibrionales bacterium]
QKPEELFPFFSEAKNLEKITPPLLQFRVLDSSTESIEQGSEINYKLKINGIPLRWKTKITEWKPPYAFVDNQEKGPYTKWNHLHKFEELGGGTLMTDRVRLIIPMGFLGLASASWKVFSDVNQIFSYRRQYIFEHYFKQKGNP